MNAKIRAKIKQRFGRVKVYKDGFSVSRARHTGKSGIVKPIVQEKPWGAEVWLVFTDKYAFKILFIAKGHRFSLQKHRKKLESWIVQSGHPLITTNRKKIQAKPGQIFHIAAGSIHRVEATRNLIEIWEVSSPELHDAVRMSDDYRRVNKKYNSK